MGSRSTSLGNFIRRHREKAGMSQAALGRAIGVPASTVMRLERGEVEAPDPDKLGRLADVLVVDPEDLFGRYPAPDRLPAPTPYLRAKFGHLPADALAEAQRLFAELEAEEQRAKKGGRRGKRAR